MNVLAIAIVALFGAIFGSFLNVCIYRIPRDLSVVAPRSFCPNCGRQLRWKENIPLLSYLLLRRRCAGCGQTISLRYPLVELASAAMFVCAYLRWDVSLEAGKWVLFDLCLLALFCTDLEERLLPDELTLGGSLVGLGMAIALGMPGGLARWLLPGHSARTQSLAEAVLGALLLAGPIWAAGAVWGRLRKREALGLGDVKLLALIGIFLGPARGLLALTLGAVSGAVLGLILVAVKKKNAATYELPFGSFLCGAALLVSLLPPGSALVLAVP